MTKIALQFLKLPKVLENQIILVRFLLRNKFSAFTIVAFTTVAFIVVALRGGGPGLISFVSLPQRVKLCSFHKLQYEFQRLY